MIGKQTLLAASHVTVRGLARLLPAFVIKALFEHTTAGLGIALCLHRVGERRRGWPAPGGPDLITTPQALDRLLLLTAGASRRGTRLSLTFDDGYADAARYILSRARRYPLVDWYYFICPEKLRKRAGFRWDHDAVLRRRGVAAHGAADVHAGRDLNVDAENDRPALRETASLPEFALATVADCRTLAVLANVTVGGHSNTHFDLCALSDEEAKRDLRHCIIDFEEMTGRRMEHFAFPFGSPGHHFRAEHVSYLQSLRNPILWSTKGQPYQLREVRPGSVLPRFTLPAGFGGDAIALWIALESLRFRIAPKQAVPWVASQSRDVGPAHVVPVVRSGRFGSRR